MLRRVFTYGLLIIFLSVLPSYSQDQAKLDSLENLIATASKQKKLSLLLELADEYSSIDPERSIDFADQAVSLARQLNDYEKEVQAYLSIGESYYLMRNYDHAHQYYQRAQETSERYDYQEGIVKALNNFVRSYYDQRAYDRATDYANQAIDLARAINSRKDESAALYYLGNISKVKNDFEQALAYYEQSLKIREEIEDQRNISQSLNAIGDIYSRWSDYNNAVSYFERALEINKSLGDNIGAAINYYNIANAYFFLSKYDFSLSNYQDALKIFEEIEHKRGISFCYNGIAAIYENQEFYNKALEFYQKKLNISEEMEDRYEIGVALNNMGIVYDKMASDSMKVLLGPEFTDSIKLEPTDKYLQIFQEALDYYLQSLQVREEINDQSGIAKTLNNIGIAYLHSGKPNLALDYFQRSMSISEELNDINELANSMLRTGECYKLLGQYDKALDNLNRSLRLALDIDVKNTIKDIYHNLSDVYNKLGQYQKALDYFKLHSTIKDSIYRKDVSDQILEMQVKYESEVKERENQLLRTRNELADTRLRQQRLIILGFITILILISGLVITLIRQNNQKKRTNRELAQKNTLITEQKKEITDSIEYASRIQSAMLPPGDYIDKLLPERFIIYMPRDIVSGDYYYITEKNDKIICVAADCTGHGVPGAFMSMLGIAFLTEIITKHDHLHTDDVLNELRIHVIKSLHQTGKEGESQDGMDVALIILDPENLTLEYSGANNSLIICRNSELLETKADKMPIGIHTRAADSFTRHNLKLQKGDMIYTFSDGYPDQFGGPKHKKFMIKNFKNLLGEVHKKPMDEQKKILEETLFDWMSETNQVDDILVIGIKV